MGHTLCLLGNGAVCLGCAQSLLKEGLALQRPCSCFNARGAAPLLATVRRWLSGPQVSRVARHVVPQVCAHGVFCQPRGSGKWAACKAGSMQHGQPGTRVLTRCLAESRCARELGLLKASVLILPDPGAQDSGGRLPALRHCNSGPYGRAEPLMMRLPSACLLLRAFKPARTHLVVTTQISAEADG